MTGLKNSRQIVAEALLRMETADGYSHIILDHLLQSERSLTDRDRAFASVLFYGVLEKKLTLDSAISRYASMPLRKMDALIRQLLRLGIYQIVYLDSVPASAAVNESVELAKRMGKKSAAGFVNGVLRAFLRDKGEIRLPDREKDPVGWLSLAYSVPRDLVKLWQNQYPDENLEEMLRGLTGRAPLFARVNSCRTDAASLCRRLGEEGVEAREHPDFADCIVLSQTGDLEKIPAFAQGLFHIQDLASQVCAAALGAEPGMRALDCCAAPGGKSFTLAQQMADQGEVVSGDLHESKVSLIRQGAARLRLHSIRAVTADASVFRPELGQFDRVLCDVPCSGLGIIRRKPEIRYKPLDALAQLPPIQYKILETAAQYVKKGGLLLYSTCTLNRRENEDLASRFLKEHPDFVPGQFPAQVRRFLGGQEGGMATLMPHRNGTDGFFFALFSRQG